MSLHYVPAGVEKYSERRIQLHLKTETNKFPATEFGRGYKRWRLPDATISMTNGTRKCTKAITEIQDVIVSLSSPSFIKNIGLNKVLGNPIHGDFQSAGFDALGIESIVDSGGFQLLTSTVDFVNPDDVIKRYNSGGGIGMPLDVPVRSVAEEMFFDTISHLIKANDLYIEPKLTNGTDLALISHGSNLERRKSRLDVLDREDAKVIAIAGLNTPPPPGVNKLYSGLENLMYVVNRFHKTARYFHVLGVTSKFWIFVYALIDALGFVKSIGADSVTHRILAISGSYETLSFNADNLPRGDRHYGSMPRCSCPVCVITGDLRLLNEGNLLEAHNLWVKVKQTEFLANLAKLYVGGHVKLLEVRAELNLNIPANEFCAMISYIESIIASGKHVPFRLKSSKSRTLFGVEKAKPTPASVVAHYGNIVKRYEEFHGVSFSAKGKKK